MSGIHMIISFFILKVIFFYKNIPSGIGIRDSPTWHKRGVLCLTVFKKLFRLATRMETGAGCNDIATFCNEFITVMCSFSFFCRWGERERVFVYFEYLPMLCDESCLFIICVMLIQDFFRIGSNSKTE